MIFGNDYLAGNKYRKQVVANHLKGAAAGIFFLVDGFGPGKPLAIDLAESGKCPVIRFQLMWKDNHDFKRSDFNTIISRASEVEKLAVKYKNIEWRISGACEHKMNLADARELARLCKIAAPSCVYVNCPMTGGAVLPEEVNEFHGAEKLPRKVPRMQFSFDGTSCVDINISEYKKNYKNAEIFFLWIPQFNGRKTTKDTTPRAQRLAYPTGELIRSINALAEDRGDTSFKGIYKSHAEQTKNITEDDLRGNRPVIIIPQDVTKILFIADNGSIVATASYGGPFSGGGFRYYAKDYGFMIARKAVKIQGHPFVRIKAGNKVLPGKINPSFRDGSFK